jgi:hypothetical protein
MLAENTKLVVSYLNVKIFILNAKCSFPAELADTRRKYKMRFFPNIQGVLILSKRIKCRAKQNAIFPQISQMPAENTKSIVCCRCQLSEKQIKISLPKSNTTVENAKCK